MNRPNRNESHHRADNDVNVFVSVFCVFIPKKDARLTENSYDTDKDLVIQKVTDTSKTLDKVMKLVTYLNKSEEDSLRLLNFDFLLVNSSK